MTSARQLFLDPSTISLEFNGRQTQYVTVVFRDTSGEQLADGSASTFVVTDPTIASVDASGTVKAVGVGTTTLTVTFAGISVTAPITVF